MRVSLVRVLSVVGGAGLLAMAGAAGGDADSNTRAVGVVYRYTR